MMNTVSTSGNAGRHFSFVGVTAFVLGKVKTAAGLQSVLLTQKSAALRPLALFYVLMALLPMPPSRSTALI